MQLKQETVAGKTYRLERKKSDRRGYDYEYQITEDGGMVEDPYYNREEAMKRFQETLNVIKRGQREDRNGGGFMMGGGYQPQIPDLMGGPTDDSDDDSGSAWPWMP